MTVSRKQALKGKCPTCGAKPHEPCIGSRGQQRSALHLDRWQAAFKREFKRLSKKYPEAAAWPTGGKKCTTSETRSREKD